jgi:hypothetical protein
MIVGVADTHTALWYLFNDRSDALHVVVKNWKKPSAALAFGTNNAGTAAEITARRGTVGRMSLAVMRQYLQADAYSVYDAFSSPHAE